jgi:hypothetical protein
VVKVPSTPEVVFVPSSLGSTLELTGMLASWNFLWEAANIEKKRINTSSEMKDQKSRIGLSGSGMQTSTYLLIAPPSTVPYAPLYHLLPKRLLDRYKLPAFRRPLWPMNGWWTEELLPADFTQRLSRAFAKHVWKYIDSGSGLASFSTHKPLAVLSHNLDSWLPYGILPSVSTDPRLTSSYRRASIFVGVFSGSFLAHLHARFVSNCALPNVFWLPRRAHAQTSRSTFPSSPFGGCLAEDGRRD